MSTPVQLSADAPDVAALALSAGAPDLDPAPRAGSLQRIGLAGRAAAAAIGLWSVLQLVGFALTHRNGRLSLPEPHELLLTALFGAAVAGVAAGLAMRAFARRLQRVEVAVGRLEAGDWWRPVRCDGSDEIGRVARRLERLRAALAHRDDASVTSTLQDPSTGLPGRALLLDRIDRCVRDARRHGREFSLLMVEPEGLTQIEQAFGRDGVERGLREAARRLQATLRDSDTVARPGGDRLAVLMSGGPTVAMEIARRIVQALRTPAQVDQRTRTPSAVIGVACHPGPAQDGEQLMRHADLALCSALRDRVELRMFDGAAAEVVRLRRSVAGELRDALARGELAIAWRPCTSPTSGRLTGAEAVVRWMHPTRGLLEPEAFMPLAEQAGLVAEIERWTLAAGIRQAARLQRDGHGLLCVVPLSAETSWSQRLRIDLRRALRAERLEPQRLCLRVPEQALADDPDRTTAALRALAACGVRLSLGGFGHGRATLAQLSALPLHAFTLDAVFVTGLCQDRGSEAIVSATVDLAGRLGVAVVADGVETGDEMQRVRELGCDEALGFRVGKPMSAQALGAFARERQGGRVLAG